MPTDIVPIIRVGTSLLVSLQGDMDDETVLRLEGQITREVARTRAKGTLIDVSGLAVVDSFIARVISRIVSMVRLLGCEAVVVGIQPAVAITLGSVDIQSNQMSVAAMAMNAEKRDASLS